MSEIVVLGAVVGFVYSLWVLERCWTVRKLEKEIVELKRRIKVIEHYTKIEQQIKNEEASNPNSTKPKHMIDGVEVEVDKNGYIKKTV
jgi:hypothetical protein